MPSGERMKIDILHRCDEASSYRAARVKSMFNVDSGANVHITADLPLEGRTWQIGLVVGASGSGKTSIINEIWAGVKPYRKRFPKKVPIIDALSSSASFDTVTSSLSAVGLGTVPAWLRPYDVLSNGEQFRAMLARILCEQPRKVVIDEFSSVVDRQVAKIGAGAFAKYWRKTGNQAVLASCHYDVIDWLQPDWVYDTNTGQFSWRSLRRRPSIAVEIWQTNWHYWPLFEPHHYLKMPHMVAATNYVGFVDDKPVIHLAVSTMAGLVEARACRLVVLPEWQGAGIALKFLETIAEWWLCGNNRYGKPLTMLFHTSHPHLAAALRSRKKWTQVSAKLYAKTSRQRGHFGTYGGHFRGVQGFRYIGRTQ